MKVLTVAQIRAAEENAVLNGIFSFDDLMYNAGCRAAERIAEITDIKGKKITVVCGKGNNGGDGIVVAYRLSCMGAEVFLYFPYGIPVTETANRFIGLAEGIPEVDMISDDTEILVDALFGIGFNREPDDKLSTVIDSMNMCDALKISIDLPSGISADSGAVSKAFRADYTMTFIALKSCFLLPPASEYCGEYFVIDIGIEPSEYTYLTVEPPVQKKRPKNSHKGDFGKALLITGSYGMCGAQILAARAAAKSGVGLVKAFVCDKNYATFTVSVPEAVTLPVTTSPQGAPEIGYKLLKTALENSDALLLGCGLGRSPYANALVADTLSLTEIPVVIDADGINAVAENIDIIRTVKAPIILTPHSAEMARLCKTDVVDIEANRVEYARGFAQKYGCIVVLKGANTIIASSDGRVYFNITGNSGMSKGGSGDVLAGILVSRLAQGEVPLKAAMSAVWLHGAAGDVAAAKHTKTAMLPSDIIDALESVFTV